MTDNILHIKNMVCRRCITVVEQIMNKLEIPYVGIKLGEVILAKNIDTIDLKNFKKELEAEGFELIGDKKSRIISQIKTEIIKFIRHSENFIQKINFSDFLADKIGLEYSYLSKLFSAVEAQTIEKYIIFQKIERVKELLIYNELSLSEISYELDYSSVQHLSRQFKNITGMTPTEFKKLKDKPRKPLDKI